MPVTAETIEFLLKHIDELLAQIADISAKLDAAAEDHKKDQEIHLQDLATIEALTRKVEELTKKIEELSSKKVRKDSHNSSMPPSNDGYEKKPKQTKSLREASNKKVGGQPGHKGNSMQITREPDETKTYLPKQCEGCPYASQCAGNYCFSGTRYECDIEVKTKITAHKVLSCNCPLQNGSKISGNYPEGITASKQYGKSLKAFVLSLLTVGYMSVNRVQELLSALQIPISTGTIQGILLNCKNDITGAVDIIRDKICHLKVINTDETGERVSGKLHWLHCLCNDEWTYMVLHNKRGGKAMEDIGILPQLNGCTIVHDFWKPYLDYTNVNMDFVMPTLCVNSYIPLSPPSKVGQSN